MGAGKLSSNISGFTYQVRKCNHSRFRLILSEVQGPGSSSCQNWQKVFWLQEIFLMFLYFVNFAKKYILKRLWNRYFIKKYIRSPHIYLGQAPKETVYLRFEKPQLWKNVSITGSYWFPSETKIFFTLWISTYDLIWVILTLHIKHSFYWYAGY